MAAPMNDHADVKGKTYSHLYSDKNFANDDEWMNFYCGEFRDCDYYKDEYNDCKGWRGRFNQRYVYGESLKCDHWKNMYDYCKKYKDTKDENALENMVQFERARNEFRLQNARNNDVWGYRTQPPADWNSPIPTVKKEFIKTESDFDFIDTTDNKEPAGKPDHIFDDSKTTEQNNNELPNDLSKGNNSAVPKVSNTKSGWCSLS